MWRPWPIYCAFGDVGVAMCVPSVLPCLKRATVWVPLPTSLRMPCHIPTTVVSRAPEHASSYMVRVACQPRERDRATRLTWPSCSRLTATVHLLNAFKSRPKFQPRGMNASSGWLQLLRPRITQGMSQRNRDIYSKGATVECQRKPEEDDL